MSNQSIAIPEHLRKFLSNSAASTDAESMAASAISIPRVSLRGRKFRLIENGEEIRRPADELFVIILAVEPSAGLMTKTYYAKAYTSGDSSPPDCSSSNGVTPDAWISNPVNDKCSTCPMNVFGSAKTSNGKKSKACKDGKRLWVVEPDKIDGTVYALGIPVTSLKAMAEYGALLKSNGIPTAAVITKLSMKDSEFPELIFEFAGILEENTLQTAMLRNEKKDWDIRSAPPALEHKPSAPLAAPGNQALLENKVEEAKKPTMSADQATQDW